MLAPTREKEPLGNCLQVSEAVITSSIQKYLDQRKTPNTNLKNMIVIEGLIGAGKTTLLRLLASKGKITFEENLGLWNYSETLTPGLLSTYLTSQDPVDLTSFQLLVASAYFMQSASMTNHTYYQERSIFAAWKVFTPELNIHTPQRIMIESYMKSLMDRMPLPKYVIFLDVPVDVCHSRILARGRPNETVTKEYLQRLRRGHRHLLAWYQSRQVPIVTLHPKEINDDILETLKRKSSQALTSLAATLP